MKTWIDFDDAPVFAIPLTDGPGLCEGMLIEGPQGWGEFSPPADLDAVAAARWLTAAIEVGTVGWPDPVRGRVPVAVTVPAVTPERARDIVLRDDRQDGADDKVPVLVELDRDHRLDIDIILVAVIRPDAVVPVALEGHADQVGNRVGELLGEVLRVVGQCEARK